MRGGIGPGLDYGGKFVSGRRCGNFCVFGRVTEVNDGFLVEVWMIGV